MASHRGLRRLLGAAILSLFTATVASTQCTTIGLTFDDGPEPQTLKLLDALKAAHLHATFFLVGQNVVKYPDIVKRIVKDGHTIGVHTWSHEDLTKLDDATATAQILSARSVIKAMTGHDPEFMRPPFGYRDERVSAVIAATGMWEAVWTRDSFDWNGASTADIVNKLANTPEGGVVLMHSRFETTTEAIRLFGPSVCGGWLVPSSPQPNLDWKGLDARVKAVLR